MLKMLIASLSLLVLLHIKQLPIEIGALQISISRFYLEITNILVSILWRSITLPALYSSESSYSTFESLPLRLRTLLLYFRLAFFKLILSMLYRLSLFCLICYEILAIIILICKCRSMLLM